MIPLEKKGLKTKGLERGQATFKRKGARLLLKTERGQATFKKSSFYNKERGQATFKIRKGARLLFKTERGQATFKKRKGVRLLLKSLLFIKKILINLKLHINHHIQ